MFQRSFVLSAAAAAEARNRWTRLGAMCTVLKLPGAGDDPAGCKPERLVTQELEELHAWLNYQ